MIHTITIESKYEYMITQGGSTKLKQIIISMSLINNKNICCSLD